jgi:hypothetical protein
VPERPDISDEGLGMRMCQVNRANAVERAVQLARHALQPDWTDLSVEEIAEFEWVLGELWAYVPHTVWDEMHFGLLDMRDVVKMLTLGSQLRRHARSSVEILREVESIVNAKTPGAAPGHEEPLP